MSFAFSKAFAPAFSGAINYNEVTIPGMPNPINGTHVISDVSGIDLVVVSILRYNGSGRFTCSIVDSLTNSVSGIMDVYYDNGVWRGKIYDAERHRDEDGVKKAM